MSLCFSFRTTNRCTRLYSVALSAAAFMLLTGSAAKAEFKLTVDLKDGDKIHDVAKIVAHADSSDGIDKVEFFVDDQLKATASGIPYTLTWDTIPDKEGKHTLAVTAYDSNGQTKKVSVSVNIDNELAMGAPALAKKAHDALVAGDLNAARNFSRRSDKAEPGNVLACRVTAALAAKDADWDKAAAALEKANGYETDPDAIAELATYRMRSAMMPENAATLPAAIQAIGDLRQKSADIVVSAVRAKNPTDHEAIGDALMRAGQYKQAQLEYQKAGDGMPISTSNRVALAYTMQDELELATSFLRPLIQEKRADKVTRAIYGLALMRGQRFAEARAAVAGDLASEYPAAIVIAAYADVVNGKTRSAFDEAELAAKLVPNAGDARYVHSMVIRNLSDSETELIHSMTLAPFEPGPLLDYASRITLQKQSDRSDDALKLVEYAVKRAPNDIGAKLTQVLMLLAKGKDKDAEPILDYQMRHTRAADVQMIGAIYLTQVNRVGQAQQAWDTARKYDPDHFDFIVVPRAAEYLQTYVRKQHYRPDCFLSYESLYAPKPAPKPETTPDAAAQ